MASNVARLAIMNEGLTAGLAPAVHRLLIDARKRLKDFTPRLPLQCNPDRLDGHACLYAIVHNWDFAFREAWPRSARSAAASALDGRNAMAHPLPGPDDSLTHRALLGAVELLTIVGEKSYADEIARHVHELSTGIRAGGERASAEVPPKQLPPKSRGGATPPQTPVRTPAESGDAGSFWVYENWTHKKAIVHVTSCSFCNNGQGMHGKSSGRNDEWHGHFPDFESAMVKARLTGQRDVRACGICCK